MNPILSLQALAADADDQAGWSTFSTGCNNLSTESNCCGGGCGTTIAG